MSNINKIFSPSGRKSLIAYITIGYPNVSATVETAQVLEKEGCDIIELGIPFSDPMADGVTIQKASHDALQNGVTLKTCFETAAAINSKVNTPLVFMTYYNPVFNYGLEEFAAECRKAGISGLIIPDLPPDESSELEVYAKRYGVDIIYLLPPTATADRIKLIADKTESFIYVVSKTGVTGEGSSISKELGAFLGYVKEITSKPLCVGFGISSTEQAKEIGKMAEGIIIGSKIIKLMEEDSSLRPVREFISDVRSTLDSL